MRLQSLNCPNCGSVMKTEGGVQICESCGSTFRIDYDDSDVEYERLSKEEELNRQKFQHEKELLETEYRLQEEARLKKAKYEKSEARKRNAVRKLSSIISLIIVAGIFFGVFVAMRKLLLKHKSDILEEYMIAGNTTAGTTVSPYLLISASDILADEEFMENALASILTEAHLERDGKTVTTYDLPVTDWNLIDGPEIYDCYLLVSEKENRLCFLIKMSYRSERDEDDIREVYDCLYLKNLTVKSDGSIACSYAVGSDRGEGATDWIWSAALDSDQLYRSAILGKSEFSREKVDLPEQGNAEDDSDDDIDEADDAEDEDEDDSEED